MVDHLKNRYVPDKRRIDLSQEHELRERNHKFKGTPEERAYMLLRNSYWRFRSQAL